MVQPVGPVAVPRLARPVPALQLVPGRGQTVCDCLSALYIRCRGAGGSESRAAGLGRLGGLSWSAAAPVSMGTDRGLREGERAARIRCHRLCTVGHPSFVARPPRADQLHLMLTTCCLSAVSAAFCWPAGVLLDRIRPCVPKDGAGCAGHGTPLPPYTYCVSEPKSSPRKGQKKCPQ